MNERDAPQIISLSAAELEKLLGELRGPLTPATYQLVEALRRTLQWVMAALEQKTASLARLRRMIFGEKTERVCKILPAHIAAILSGPAKPKARGHGRKGAKDYPAAQRVQVPHHEHKAGDLCPKCLEANLYRFLTPARLVRMVAQPIFQAKVFELERPRYALCGALFTAPAPPEAGQGKYDPSVGTMLALMRYAVAIIFAAVGFTNEAVTVFA
jgi:hypothetical protein